nr:integrase, catalytic region, zinc finger, CCHC-type, peptidase aspartic, catalytic [Tanacetum cinerariifolium]
MSTQQDIYASGSENRPPMFNKENYVPWSSCLLRYAKSRPNEKLIHNSIINGPYVRRMIPEPGDPNREVPIQADDQAIQTILLGLPEDIYAAVDSCETAQEIWLRVQQMMKGSDIEIQEKKDRNQVIQNADQNPRIQNVGNQNGLIVVSGNANQDPNGNGNLVAARAEGNTTGHNRNQIRCYNYRGVGHFARNCTIRPRRRDAAYLQTQLLIAQKEEAGIQLQAEEFDLMATATDLDEIEEYTELLESIPEPHQVPHNDNNVISEEKYDKLERCYQKSVYQEQCLSEKINALHLSSGKQIMTLNEEILDLNKQLLVEKSIISSLLEEKKRLKFDFKIRKDKLLDKQIQLEKRIKELDNILVKTGQSIQTIHMLSPKPDSFYHTEQKTAFAKFVGDFKSLAKEADESLAKHKALELEIESLLRAVVSQDIMSVVQNNSVDETSNLQTELERTKKRFEKCIIKKENEYAKLWNDWYKKCEKGKFAKISYDKAYNDMQQKIERLQAQLGDLKEFRVLNYAKENAHLKTTYKNLFDSIFVTRTQTKTIIDSLQNKLHDTKENAHLRAQLFDKVSDQKDTACGTSANTKFAKQSILGKPPKVGIDNTKTRKPQPRSNTKNDRVPSASKSSHSKNKEAEVEEHHRKLLLSRNKKHMSSECTNKQKANVSINEKQNKQQPKVKKTKKVGSIERLASPKPRKPRSFLRWSPTGRPFDLKGKIIASSESESQSDCSKGDNACTSNPLEAKIKRFPNFTFSLAGQFCDSDLKVAFRRNTCFVRNLEGVDLLKRNRTTNLYTINLHAMASASPICIMARASSTKSWLWHQHLYHLNFDTINDLAKNDLVSGLSKFKYHKEHLCPFCEQGKSKRASHPPKPVPNSRQRLHLLHMDLCGPMRISSINGKRVVERRNRTLVEAVRTTLIFSRAPLFLWAKAIATACFTQNRSIIHRRFYKTPYELINGRNPDISFLHVFGALCYLKNNRENIGKLGAKGDIGFFIGYSAYSYAFRVFNRRTKKIIETMNMSFDELSAMAFEQRSSKPSKNMTFGQISSGLDLTYAPSTITTQQPTEGELDLLFEAMYDDYIGGQPSAALRTVRLLKHIKFVRLQRHLHQ